jgi:hypothetical protein
MNKIYIDVMLREKRIRPITAEIAKVRSLIDNITTNAQVVLGIALDKNSATVIYRELYECIREIGDALWWLEGYEPLDHGISIEILEMQKVTNQTSLRHLETYKKIRHDIHYRGFRASEAQAKELIDFWNTSGKELLEQIKKRVA